MRLPKVLSVIAMSWLITACDVPQPGDPDYARYQQSKTDRAERLYEGF